MTEPITIIPVAGIGEIAAGDDLAGIIAGATTLVDGDVVVVTQKIVSKAEAMLEAVDPDDPLSHKAIVERESVRVLRRRGDLIISETKHGFVCANAGVDFSNVEAGQAALLPVDADRSARLSPVGAPEASARSAWLRRWRRSVSSPMSASTSSMESRSTPPRYPKC